MALQQEWEKQGNWLFRYRGQLPVVILIAGLALTYWSSGNNQLPFSDDRIWTFLCLGIVALGQIVRGMVIGFTPRNTSGRNTQAQLADVVNTTGIYSIVRHPLYLGNFFMWLGIAMLTQHLWFVVVFILVFWLFYEKVMYAEEQFLTRSHGQVYLEWASRVPAFIPASSGWKPSALSFSFRNILKRESIGILNVFICFYLFSLIAELAAGKTFSVDNFWFQTLVVVTAITAVIYVLRKWTKVLEVEGR